MRENCLKMMPNQDVLVSEGVIIELMNSIDAEMERNDEMTSPELAQRIFKVFRIQFSRPKSQASLAKTWQGTDRYQVLPANLGAKQYSSKYSKVIGILHVVPKRE